MKYLLLIHKDEARFRATSEQERAALEARYGAWGREVMKRARSGARLEHAETATTVRVQNGKAARHPDAEWASVQVRPVMVFMEGAEE